MIKTSSIEPWSLDIRSIVNNGLIYGEQRINPSVHYKREKSKVGKNDDIR